MIEQIFVDYTNNKNDFKSSKDQDHKISVDIWYG
jgi:hypothetical protein